jgi:hypothetical protein
MVEGMLMAETTRVLSRRIVLLWSVMQPALLTLVRTNTPSDLVPKSDGLSGCPLSDLA